MLALSWQEITGWLALIDTAITVAVLVWVLSVKRDTPAAVAWCLTVLLVPVLGWLLFIVFGYQSVHRPLRRKRAHAHGFRRTHAPTSPTDGYLNLGSLAVQLEAEPITLGNRVALYDSGDEAYAAMLAGIASAQHHLHVQFFIFRSDASGERFIKALTERARAGVEVRFLYDAVGSWGIRASMLQELRDAGGKVEAFMTLVNPLRRLMQINLRNHRKMLIVDGRLGFTGGFNIGDEYLGLKPRFGPWRDTLIEVEGPAVAGLFRIFREDWHFASNEMLEERIYVPNGPSVGGVPMQIASSGPDRDIKTIREIHFAAILRAKSRVWWTSPYVVPDAGLQDALELAARGGCDVRILLPFRPDKWLPHFASRYRWRELFEAGVKIHQYMPGFIHAKTLLIDDTWASVGTANMDDRSHFLNFELTYLIHSPEVAEKLAVVFREDVSHSIEVNPAVFASRPGIGRLLENACRLFSPVL